MSPRMGRPKTGTTPNISIRIDHDVYHQARIAAVIECKTLGKWLEEAIREKIETDSQREKGLMLLSKYVVTN